MCSYKIPKVNFSQHRWCHSVSLLPLSIKSALKSSQCQTWRPHTQSEKAHVSMMCAWKILKVRCGQHRWCHTVSWRPLLIQVYLNSFQFQMRFAQAQGEKAHVGLICVVTNLPKITWAIIVDAIQPLAFHWLQADWKFLKFRCDVSRRK